MFLFYENDVTGSFFSRQLVGCGHSAGSSLGYSTETFFMFRTEQAPVTPSKVLSATPADDDPYRVFLNLLNEKDVFRKF